MKLIIVILILFLHGCSFNSKVEKLCEEGNTLVIDWELGYLSDNGDITLGAFRCPEKLNYNCLIIEGYGITLGYDDSIQVGDSWYFNGLAFNYIMNFANGEKLLTSRFTEETIKNIGDEHRFKVSFYKLRNDNLIEVKHFYNFENGNKGDVRSFKACENTFITIVPKKTAEESPFVMSMETLEACKQKDSYNCFSFYEN